MPAAEQHETAVPAAPILPSDEELIRRTAEGDHAAFQALVERHHAGVCRFLRVVVRAHDDTEDLVQETFLAAFRFAHQFRGEASFRTWLFRIAKNAAYQAHTKSSRQNERTVDLVVTLRAVAANEDPEQRAIMAQRWSTLERLLASLDPEDRRVLMLRDFRGLSGEDTARVLGIGLAAMKSRLHRARMRLAAGLRRRAAA